MRLDQTTWPVVEKYLKKKTKIILPVGSTEQHGPTGIYGTDYQTALHIANAVGEKTQTLVAPPLCFGMAVHHMAFSGTMTLSPQTYIQVVVELLDGLYGHGFQEFYFINGHGGNIAPLTTAFCQFNSSDEVCNTELFNWWQMPEIQEYEKKHFGDQNGFHATCGEVSVTHYLFPETFAQIENTNFDPDAADLSIWPLSPQQFREKYPDGRMGSNPGLANKEHGKILFNIACDTIAKKIKTQKLK